MPNCQAQVERVVDRYNLARVIAVTKYGPCKFRAVAKLGELCLCTLHTRLALEGLVDEKGKVADRGSLRDVRRYPNKFPGGLYEWAQDKEPVALEPPPSLPRRKEIAHG